MVRARNKATRAERQVDNAYALQRARTQADVTQAELALSCGVSTSRVQQWEDPTRTCAPSLHDVQLWPEAVRLAYIEATVGDELVVAKKLAVAGEALSVANLRRSLRESHEFHDALAEALEDEELTDEELSRIAKEGTDMVALGRSLIETTQEELRRRRSVVRSIVGKRGLG